MPVRTIQQTDTATYYTLKKFEYTQVYNGKKIDIKAPCFTIYDKELGTEKFFSNMIGGYLYKVTLGEAKEFISSKSGQPFMAQDVYFEIHSYDKDATLVREVVKVTRNSSLLENLVSKLFNLENFADFDIQVGRFKPKGVEDYVDFLTVWQDSKKIDPKIIIEKDDMVKNDNILYIPKKVYKDIKKKTLDPVTKKPIFVDAKEIDKDWVVEKDQIFDNALEILIEQVKEHSEKNPLLPPAEKTIQKSEVEEIFESEIQGVNFDFE